MRSPVAGGHEPISPELVLVDPTLRRLLLHHPPAQIPQGTTPPTAEVVPLAAPEPRSRRASWRSHVLVAAAAAAVTAAVVITPGGATPTPPAPQRAVTHPTPIAAPRTFAWVASPGAAGYRFVLYRGDEVVFTAATPEHQLMLPSSWSDHGVRRTLRSGDYRWYVWGLDAVGRRQGARALVQATLEVPS